MKLKAYLRLLKGKDRRKRIEETAFKIHQALYAKLDNDNDRAKAMEIANVKFERQLAERREVKMQSLLETEVAHDLMKMVNIKYR